ncbi:ABC transporter substrate-binding protein [Bradyrhizobium sp. RDT46]|uniref:ABC transporter substrate-binding protein n=1 Tax=Bradyrhizobium sp. RDT46 TaxID=3341829 RepID=UPI0035C6F045
MTRRAAIGLAALTATGLAVFAVLPDVTPPVHAPVDSSLPASFFLDGPYAARFAGEMIAAKEGYFKRGIAVRTIPDDPDFVETVAKENAIGVTTGQKFLLAVWRGVSVTAFAASFLDTPVAIFALEQSGLRHPEDLVGRRIGCREGSEAEVIFDAMMAKLRLPRSRVVKVPDRATFQALISGEVDAIVVPTEQQPSHGSAASVPLSIMKPQDYALHVPGQVYFASTDLIRGRPSTIADLLHGLVRGWQFAYADYSRSIPIIVDFDRSHLAPERVRFEMEQQRSLVLPVGARIGEYDESRWRTLRDILVFAGLGKENDVLFQAVNTRFIHDEYRRAPEKGAAGAFRGAD